MLNNPLKYTDPSGYFFDAIIDGIKDFLGRYGKIIAMVVIGVATGGAGLAAAGAMGLTGVSAAMVGGAAAGFVTGGIASGSLKGALRGALFGAIAGGVASWVKGLDYADFGNYAELGRDLVHGVTQGMVGSAFGSDFKSGFFGGFIGHFAGRQGLEYFPKNGNQLNKIARTTIAAMGGGIAAKLGGGKFENGAVSGAFAHLFNTEVTIAAKAKFGKLMQIAYDEDKGLVRSLAVSGGKFSLTLNEDGSGVLTAANGKVVFDASQEMKEMGISYGAYSGTFGGNRNGDFSTTLSLGRGNYSMSVRVSVNVVDAITTCSGLLCDAANLFRNRNSVIRQSLGR